MVAHGRVELLAHPLSQKYLQMKWNSYGKYFHLANVLFYCIYLTFVTLFTYKLMSKSSTKTYNYIETFVSETSNKTNSSGLLFEKGISDF